MPNRSCKWDFKESESNTMVHAWPELPNYLVVNMKRLLKRYFLKAPLGQKRANTSCTQTSTAVPAEPAIPCRVSHPSIFQHNDNNCNDFT